MTMLIFVIFITVCNNTILEIMKTVLRIQKKDSMKKLQVAMNTLSKYTCQDLKLTFKSLLSYLLQDFLLYSNFQRFQI